MLKNATRFPTTRKSSIRAFGRTIYPAHNKNVPVRRFAENKFNESSQSTHISDMRYTVEFAGLIFSALSAMIGGTAGMLYGLAEFMDKQKRYPDEPLMKTQMFIFYTIGRGTQGIIAGGTILLWGPIYCIFKLSS